MTATLGFAPAPPDAAAILNALVRLESLDSRKAAIARMRLVGKLTVGQVAFLLGLDEATVDREWCFARAWLAREVGARNP